MWATQDRLQRDANNFDLLRMVAALCVLVSHAPYVLWGESWSTDPFYYLFGMSMGSFGVHIFFVISGFLVTHSYLNRRNDLDFVLARVLRIMPALIAVVVLTTLIGVLFSRLSAGEYFTHPTTWSYLNNVLLFRMSYHLPEVFMDLPLAQEMNGSLWSLPFEVVCYGVLFIIGIIKLLNHKHLVMGAFLLLATTVPLYEAQLAELAIPLLQLNLHATLFLLTFFLAGTVLYLFRERIGYNRGVSVLLLLAYIAIVNTTAVNWFQFILFPYLVIAAAFQRAPRLARAGRFGDPSYGIYLWAFPIQQITSSLFQEQGMWLVLPLSLLVTVVLGYGSWHLLEVRFLRLRRKRLDG